MLILGIDPGVESPGYAVWCTAQKRHVYVGSRLPVEQYWHAAVVESGFIGRIGKLGMWGLGFGAGWRLYEAYAERPPAALYKIRPDGKAGWRAALPPKPGTFQEYDGCTGDVIVNRLRHRYEFRSCEAEAQFDGVPWQTDDMVEACGIAEAAAAILSRPKASQRKALKPVRFG